MKARKVFVLFSALYFIGMSLHAQSVLVRGEAYAKKANYGREMIDIEGKTVNRPDSTYEVYLELKGKDKPTINKAMFNGRLFLAEVVAVPAKLATVGKLHSTKKEVTLRSRATTTLWRIVLTRTGTISKTSRPKGLLLTGTASGKSFVFSVPRWTLLAEEVMG